MSLHSFMICIFGFWHLSPLFFRFFSHKNAHFMSVDQMIDLLRETGFQNLRFYQTLTKPVLTEIEQPQPGYGKGSFVVVIAKGGGAECH